MNEPTPVLAKPSDDLSTGLTTGRWADHGWAGREVTWIAWDSPFRDTELAIGDVILAADGVSYDPRREAILPDFMVGSFGEPRYWREQGRREGDPVRLEVWREHQELTVEGRLAAERFYFDAEGRTALGPGGPYKRASDGFSGSWDGWYEALVKKLSSILDHGWRRRTFDSRRELAELHEEAPRVRHVVETCPGPFAEALEADFTAALDSAAGRLWPAETIDLSFRERRQRLADRIAEVAGEAEAAFAETVAERSIPASPAPDPIELSPEEVAGKVVRLDRVGPRSMRMDAGHPWYVFGDRHSGYLFLDAESASARAFHEAVESYRLLVSYRFPETYRFYGEILPSPRMRVVDDQAQAGFTLELLAANLADRVFIPIRSTAGGSEGNAGPFAGAELLRDAAVDRPAATAAPEEVLATAFGALKLGRRDLWEELFADWHLSRNWNGSVTYTPFALRSPSELHSGWDFAQKELESNVEDVRIVAVGPLETVLGPEEGAPAPRIEECRIEVEHVGLFDGEHRSFVHSRFHRVWTLQRRDGGPWRIRDIHGL